MPILVCTGSLNSRWLDVCRSHQAAACRPDPGILTVTSELSQITSRIFAERQVGQAQWQRLPLQREEGRRLLPVLQGAARRFEGPVVWGDSNASLLLEAFADMSPDSRFLLIYSEPAQEFRAALGQSSAPADWDGFMTAWCIRTRAMLRFCLRHRRSSLLIDSQAFAAAPSRLSELVRERWGLEFPVEAGVVEGPAVTDPIAALLSRLYLEHSEEIAELYDQVCSVADMLITASEQGAINVGHPAPDVVPALLEYLELRRSDRARRADADTVADLRVAKQELEVVLADCGERERRSEAARLTLEAHSRIEPRLLLVQQLRLQRADRHD